MIRNYFVIVCFALVASSIAGEETVDKLGTITDEDKALLEKFDASIDAIRKSPGRESSNFITDPQSWMRGSYLVMKGQGHGNVAHARNTVAPVMRTALQGLDWPMPKDVDIPKAKGKISIDGKLDEADWAHAVVLDGMYLLNSKDNHPELANKWRLLWDEQYLYISMEAGNSDVIATKEPRDGKLYKNDCAEIFLLPNVEKGLFWELQFNPFGSIYDALHQKYLDRWGEEPGGDAKTMEGVQFACQIMKEDGKPSGYTIEAAIPLAQLPGFDPAKDRSLRLMLVRADRKGKDVNYYSYSPLLSWGHNIWNFGKFNLSE